LTTSTFNPNVSTLFVLVV